MALTSSQLSDLLAKAKTYLRKSDDDPSLLQDGFTIYHDESSSATAATVGLSGTTLTLVITGGSNAGTRTLDLTSAANDTLSELVAALPDEGWVGDLVGDASASSDTLRPVSTVSVFGTSNIKTLRYTDNAALELIIQQCFDAIESAVGRSFFTATVDERVFTSNSRTLMLKQPDVQRVGFLALDSFNAMRVEYTGSGQRATVEVTDTMLRLVARTGATDTETTYTFSNTDFDTVGELVTTVSALSDWSATLQNDGPSRYLLRRPAVGVKTVNGTQAVTLESWQSIDDDYDLDYGAGLIYLPCEPPYGIAKVTYTYGSDTLPTPVERELLRMVKAQYESLERDSAAKSMRLGDYAISTDPEMVASTLDAEDVARRLQRYRRVLP
jgi:hypothetical protein